MFHGVLDIEDLSYDVELDDQGQIVLTIAICRCVIEQASAANCVSLVSKVVSDTKHLITLFDEDFVSGVVQNEIIKTCQAEFDRFYKDELFMLTYEVKQHFGLNDGKERELIVKADSNKYWRVVLHRANVSLDDLVAAIKDNDPEAALSGRLMWGQLKADGTEPNWWVELDL